MTDKEKREEDVLKNCIQEAYALSDEQLLAEMDEIEATLSEDEFEGVEERIYRKLMARVEEERKPGEHTEQTEHLKHAEHLEHTGVKAFGSNTKGKKRRSYKKIARIGILAAVFAGVLGVTAVGDRGYLLRQSKQRDDTVLDSGKNEYKEGTLDDAYNRVKQELNIPAMKMNYIPKGMKYEKYSQSDEMFFLVFQYHGNQFYLIQERIPKSRSINIQSDRKEPCVTVYNEWLKKEINIYENILENGEKEYSALVYMDDACYMLLGIISKEEMVTIIKNIYL